MCRSWGRGWPAPPAASWSLSRAPPRTMAGAVEAAARHSLEGQVTARGMSSRSRTRGGRARAAAGCLRNPSSSTRSTRTPSRMRSPRAARAGLAARSSCARPSRPGSSWRPRTPANRPLRDEDVTLARRDVTAARDAPDPAAIDGIEPAHAARGELRRTQLVAPTLAPRRRGAHRCAQRRHRGHRLRRGDRRARRRDPRAQRARARSSGPVRDTGAVEPADASVRSPRDWLQLRGNARELVGVRRIGRVAATRQAPRERAGVCRY